MNAQAATMVEAKLTALMRQHAPGASALVMHVNEVAFRGESLGQTVIRLMGDSTAIRDAEEQRLMGNFRAYLTRMGMNV